MGADVVAIVGLVMSGVTLLCVIGGGFYWWGRLSSRVDTLDKRVDELNGKIDGVRDELNGKIDGVRDELNGKIDAVRDEILAEIRRSEERILTALANHSHVNPEAGRPVFWQPFGQPSMTETPAAPQPDVEAPVA